MPDRPNQQDVLLALLALDSYSRGAHAQILDKKGKPLATTIGTATWIRDSDELLGATSVGFSASKYTLSDNTTVIAYRGTDFDISSIQGAKRLWQDIANGWFSSFGVYADTDGNDNLQPYYAQQFYELVTGRSLFPDGSGSGTPGQNIIITGHSLGGSLAGYIASLSKDEAVIFNEIPFLGLALTKAINTFVDSVKDRADFSTLLDELVKLLTGQEGSLPSFNLPTVGNITSFQTVGEVAQLARILGPFLGQAVNSFFSNLVSAAAAVAALTYGQTTFALQPTVTMPSDGGLRSPVNLHSQALMVLLTFAASKDYQDWQAVGPQLLDALFNDDVANADNVLQLLQGYGGAAAKLMAAIAYSTVDPGQGAAFGDTGALSLFNDANDLGYVIKLPDHNAFFESNIQFDDVTTRLARIVTQYAGALAVYNVDDAGAKPVLGNAGATGGVIALSDDKSALALDLSSILWGELLKSGTNDAPDRLKPIDEDEFRAAFFAQSAETSQSLITQIINTLTRTSGSTVNEQALDELAGFWDASSGSIFDRYHLATGSADEAITLSERSYKDKIPATEGEKVHVDVYIATQNDDEVHGTSGNDLLILGAGDDVVYSRGGRDMVLGGTGNDEFVDQITETSGPEDDGSDIYVGDTLDKGLVEGFYDYLRGLVGAGDEDIVRYSVEDPVTHQLAARGVEILAGEIVSYGDAQGIKLTVRDLNTGRISNDILIDIDVIKLSERADKLTVNDATSKLPIIVDLSNPTSAPFGEKDFDTVTFETRSTGVITINGAVRDNSNGAGSVVDLNESVALTLLKALFKPQAELHFRGAENVTLTSKDDIYFGGNLSNLLGTSQGFFGEPNHPGIGRISGGDGKDTLVYYGAGHRDAGELVDPSKPDGPRAAEELFLTLDGGAGNDDILIVGGEQGVVVGGLGRDWIYNRSNGGIIYGDTDKGEKAEDTAANSDNIWYSANTIVKDAQHHDFLKFYGLTLTGGNAEGGIAGLPALGGIGGAVGMANFQHSLDENGKYDPARSIYYDNLLPWMTYMFRQNGSNPDGTKKYDMYVTSQFDQLFTAVFDATPSDAYKAQQALDAQGILKGWMKVENFDLLGSYIGNRQAELTGQGTFGMVFKAVNPLADIMAMIGPLVGVIGYALAAQYGGDVLIDQALTLSAAIERRALGMAWCVGADPLVIDLDGDGIETTEIATSQVYFDVDGDLFAERTGWLKGDDGFLVRDLNGNGRIDDVSEMFGGVGRSGFAQLAALDSNGDGKITRADLLWAELKVWQDDDRDGLTDAGELRSLDALGIVSLDLGATAIDLRTPQGARLTGYGDVTFEDGAVRRMFDAILASNDTDTRFAGEAGRAVWQPAETLDLKGFGRITDLSVATANDIGFSALVGSTAAAMTSAKLGPARRSRARPARSRTRGPGLHASRVAELRYMGDYTIVTCFSLEAA